MGFLYLFISIFGESAGNTIEKLNFARNRITPQQDMFLGFLAMYLSILFFILIDKQPFPHFTAASLGLILLIAAFSFGGNVFDVLSMKANDLSLREPLVDFEPIVAGLVAYVLFPAERKPAFLVAFALGALIVRWGIHRRKLRKHQIKGLFYLWIAVFLYAILPALYKEALSYMSPVYIAFFRLGSVLFLTTIFFPIKSTKGLTGKKVHYSFVSGVVYAIAAVTGIYAIEVLGVVLTMLFLMLGPAMRYFAGYFILREKVRRGEIISSLLLALVVIVAALVR